MDMNKLIKEKMERYRIELAKKREVKIDFMQETAKQASLRIMNMFRDKDINFLWLYAEGRENIGFLN